MSEETGRQLQSVGLQRAGRDLMTKRQPGLGWQEAGWEETQSDCRQLYGVSSGDHENALKLILLMVA